MQHMKMHRQTVLAALVAITLGLAGTSQADIISSTGAETSDSGGLDFGQELRLNSSQAAFSSAVSATLDSATLYRGKSDGGSDTLYLDVYVATSAAELDPDFSSGTPSGVNYLGSSTNSQDHDAASNGDALTWTFTGITIPIDRDFFLVFSDDASSGSFIGSSFGATTNDVYTNITDADSDPLFGGTGTSNANDHRYSVSVTTIPEPATLAMIGLGGLAMVHRRRSH